jgi:hypothetical protein
MPARRDGWIVLRCVNRRDHRVNGEWRIANVADAHVARLDETLIAPLASTAGAIPFVAEARAIVTILARVTA